MKHALGFIYENKCWEGNYIYVSAAILAGEGLYKKSIVPQEQCNSSCRKCEMTGRDKCLPSDSETL